MKRILIIMLVAVSMFSCSLNDKTEKKLLTPANLESLVVKVNPDTDTLIRTPKGAKIKISKGTFDVTTELEIKEAYSIKDMLLAGLLTEGDSTLLQSGGMVYINTANGDPLKLNKSIGITVPAEYLEETMKLYKGTLIDERVSWQNPTSLDTTPDLTSIESGKILFQKCYACHRIFQDATGPAFRDLEKRGRWSDHNELLKFLNNPPRYMATDPYTRDLKNRFGSTMQAFPDLTIQDVDNLINFIKNEERKSKLTGVLAEYTPPLVSRADTSIVAGAIYETYPDTLGLLNDTSFGFTDIVNSDNYYEFQIETLGWYNIDAEMPGLPGTVSCKLEVSLENAAIEGISVYLFIPGRKNLSVGLYEEGDKFSFNKYNNAIPLVLNDRAFILAFGNKGEQFYYGITGFTVSRKQNVRVSLSASTKDQFLQAIKNEKLEGLNMKIVRPK